MGRSKKISKHKLIIAAAGSGKTRELIKRIKDKIKLLPPSKHLIVITYTNAATNEIKERLEKETNIPENVFIGTIHSFLIRYVIKPYGKVLGLASDELIITDYDIKIDLQPGNQHYQRKNQIINALSRKGIITYDGVITLAKKILEKKDKKDVVRERFCKRIAYLFVDEFQDCDSNQFEIFEMLRKGGYTEIVFVGDPEQNIMNFRKKGKNREIKNHPIISLQGKRTCHVECMKDNYRSSETIVKFINHFHVDIKQLYKNRDIISKNPIVFIESTELNEIVHDFNDLCTNKKYCENKPKKRFFLAHENKEFDEYRINNSGNGESKQEFKVIDLIMQYLSALYNVKKSKLISHFNMETIEFRKRCLNLFFQIRSDSNMKIEHIITHLNSLFPRKISTSGESKNIQFKIDKIVEDFIKDIQSIGFIKNIDNIIDGFEDHFLTIHKSKGLQADAVLAVASTEKELLKWLEIDKNKRLSDKTDDCRLGYVAFSRAKEFLCIACRRSISDSTRQHLNNLGVVFYSDKTTATKKDLTYV